MLSLDAVSSAEGHTDFRPIIGPRILPFLPEIMPELLKQLEENETCAKLDRELQHAVLSLLTGLYERVSSFMAPYVSNTIPKIVQLRSQEPSVSEGRDALIEAVTRTQGTDVCIEALSGCWMNVPRQGRVWSNCSMANLDFYRVCEDTGACDRRGITRRPHKRMQTYFRSVLKAFQCPKRECSQT